MASFSLPQLCCTATFWIPCDAKMLSFPCSSLNYLYLTGLVTSQSPKLHTVLYFTCLLQYFSSCNCLSCVFVQEQAWGEVVTFAHPDGSKDDSMNLGWALFQSVSMQPGRSCCLIFLISGFESGHVILNCMLACRPTVCKLHWNVICTAKTSHCVYRLCRYKCAGVAVFSWMLGLWVLLKYIDNLLWRSISVPLGEEYKTC